MLVFLLLLLVPSVTDVVVDVSFDKFELAKVSRKAFELATAKVIKTLGWSPSITTEVKGFSWDPFILKFEVQDIASGSARFKVTINLKKLLKILSSKNGFGWKHKINCGVPEIEVDLRRNFYLKAVSGEVSCKLYSDSVSIGGFYLKKVTLEIKGYLQDWDRKVEIDRKYTGYFLKSPEHIYARALRDMRDYFKSFPFKITFRTTFLDKGEDIESEVRKILNSAWVDSVAVSVGKEKVKLVIFRYALEGEL